MWSRVLKNWQPRQVWDFFLQHYCVSHKSRWGFLPLATKTVRSEKDINGLKMLRQKGLVSGMAGSGSSNDALRASCLFLKPASSLCGPPSQG